MKNIIVLCLILTSIGCKNNNHNKNNTPTGFPFGFNLNDFTNDRTNNYGGGDCWGAIRQFTNGENIIVTDSTACSEYSFEHRFYSLKGTSLLMVQIQESISQFNDTTETYEFATAETIYDFSQKPAVLFKRAAIISKPDLQLLKAPFEKQILKDENQISNEFKTKMEASWKQKLLEEEEEENTRLGTNYYICFNEDHKKSPDLMIAYLADGKAVYAKYKGQSTTLNLDFIREETQDGGAHPTFITHYNEIVAGETNGKYIITHSGNWDYVEYKRGKDNAIFKFTIDHSTIEDGYPETPCF